MKTPDHYVPIVHSISTVRWHDASLNYLLGALQQILKDTTVHHFDTQGNIIGARIDDAIKRAVIHGGGIPTIERCDELLIGRMVNVRDGVGTITGYYDGMFIVDLHEGGTVHVSSDQLEVQS